MRKIDALARFIMVHSLSGAMPLYVVNEYPKSGGTWFGQMLSRVLDVPFPRNRMAPLRSCIMHGHYRRRGSMRNVVVVWRDGRDVMVSWYYHCIFPNDRENTVLVKSVRKQLQFEDYADVRTNLPEFIEFAFEEQRHPRFSWSDFVRDWRADTDAVHVRYEDLRRDTASELTRVARQLAGVDISPELAAEVAAEFSFERRSGRRPGEEDRGSFMRKGIVGDWRNHFSPRAREVFDRHAGDQLMALGYEQNRAWLGGE